MKNHQPLAAVDTSLLAYLWERHSSFSEVMKSIKTSIDKVYTAGKEEARAETLQTVRAEAESKMQYTKGGTDERALIYNKAISGLLAYLDAEIAKAKNHE